MITYDSFPEWYSGKIYHDSAPVIPAARSFAMLHEPRSRRAVLLVHGYAGYPGELVSVARALYDAGSDCFVPRLPGMGTSGRDFIETSRYDWLGLVDNAASFLLDNYDSVDILGHSMGCLLAVLECRSRSFRRAVLAMPAFRIPGLDPLKVRALSLVRKDMKVEWNPDPRYNMHYENAPCDDLTLGREYYSHMYPAQLYQMARLIQETDAAMAELKIPVLVLASRADTVTDASKVEDYAQYVSIRWIDGATHFVYYDIDPACEKEAIEATVGFLGD